MHDIPFFHDCFTSEWHKHGQFLNEWPWETWMFLSALYVYINPYFETKKERKSANLQNEAHEGAPSDSDWPVRFILSLSTLEEVRIHGASPGSMMRNSEFRQDMYPTCCIVYRRCLTVYALCVSSFLEKLLQVTYTFLSDTNPL